MTQDEPSDKDGSLFATKNPEETPVLKECSAPEPVSTKPGSAGFQPASSDPTKGSESKGSEPGSTLRPLPIACCDGTPAVRAGVPPTSHPSDSDSYVEFQASLPAKSPKIFSGLIPITLLSCAITWHLYQAGPVFPNTNLYINSVDLHSDWNTAIAWLPFQVYLMARLYQLSRAVGAKFKRYPPFNGMTIYLIATFSMLTMPAVWNFTTYGAYSSAGHSLQSEINIIWMILQLILPLGILRYMRRNAEGGGNYNAEVVLLTCAALELYFNTGSNFCSYWFLTQFITIKYAWSKILGRVRPDAGKQKIPAAGNDTVIEYHPFAAITRWRKQQEGALSKDLKVILCFAIPMLAVCFLLSLGFLVQVERQARSQRIAMMWERRQAESADEIEAYRHKLIRIIKVHAKQLPKLTDGIAHFSINPSGSLSNDISVTANDEGNSASPGISVNDRSQIEQLIASIDILPPPPSTLGYRLRVSALFSSSGTIDVMLGQPNAQSNPDAPPFDLKNQKLIKEKIVRQEFESQASKSFLDYLQFGSIALFFGTLIFVASKPSHLGFSPRGWRFLWRRRFHFRNGGYQTWSDIERIYMDKPQKSTSPLDEELCFKLHNGAIRKLKMGSMESVEDRELLLKSIEKWAPSVARDASVMQALQAPADHSYTELWLQALSAPPKRERLKPLVKGTELKKGIYKIMDQIGAGGQGHAYLAINDQGETYVLKECLLPVYVDVSVRRAALEVFENEARLLRQIDHPQIVKLIDFFVEDHRTYLVLEHIDGMSLRQIVKTKGALSEKQVRDLSQQMCEILKCLHGLNPPVVHRDFTPDNLILHRDGTLKLIDFNVAKQVVESTTSGTVVGKHAYLPPEQFRGMPECASDIYAMGATIHFLLCGADPVPISTSHPKRFVTSISDSINAIVERATALDLKKRYNSIQDLLSDLSTDA